MGSRKSRLPRFLANNNGAQSRQRRSQETDYLLLHEIARHGAHVSETLNVAIRSLNALRQHHERFRTNTGLACENGRRRWDKVGNRFEFQVRFLEGLLQRSEANNARIQNEITLVSLWFRFGVDHQAYGNRLSMQPRREIAGSKYK